MTKVAIVILNWNGAAMLRRYLPKVIEHAAGEAEVIVADNASTDDSLAVLEREFEGVRTIVLDRNWGFAEGYNKALAQVDAEYFVLLNSDIETTPGWLTPLIGFMDANPDVAACQPKLMSVANRTQFEYAGASGGFLDRYGYPYCRGRIFDTIETDEGQYDDVDDVLWATGAALFVRARIYNNVGGLDPRFFAHQEEIDLCWRMNLRGYRVCCVPQSKVYHVGGGTLPKSNPMKTFLNFRNSLTMLYKCLPEEDLKPVMRMRCVLDYVAALETLILKRNWGDFRAIIRARRAFKAWRKDFVEDRQAIQQSRTTPGDTHRKSFSLLWQYYLRGKKRYQDLPN